LCQFYNFCSFNIDGKREFSQVSIFLLSLRCFKSTLFVYFLLLLFGITISKVVEGLILAFLVVVLTDFQYILLLSTTILPQNKSRILQAELYLYQTLDPFIFRQSYPQQFLSFLINNSQHGLKSKFNHPKIAKLFNRIISTSKTVVIFSLLSTYFVALDWGEDWQIFPIVEINMVIVGFFVGNLLSLLGIFDNFGKNSSFQVY